jgi:hypothetical protein
VIFFKKINERVAMQQKLTRIIYGLASALVGWMLMTTPVLASDGKIKTDTSKDQLATQQVIDLRIIKVQIKQGNLKNNQFVVLKNYGVPVKLGDLKLRLLTGNSPTVKREVALGELQFGKTNTQLATGEVLILVNNLELAKNFLNLQTNLVQCLSNCHSAEPWLELGKAGTKQQLQVIYQSTNQVITQFNYLKTTSITSSDCHQFADYDFLSVVTINGRESDIWQGFSALRADPIWLKAEQLPPLMALEPKCKTSEELISGQCLQKCAKNYTRKLDTGICERDPCPTGQELDKVTDTCVVLPITCQAGYILNPTTQRCNKIKAIEPKNCPDGYVLNLATNRCNKIVLAVAKPPCPDGQLRHPETGRCRKIVLEAECTNEQELINGKCLKRCADNQIRNPLTNRCQKVEQACQAGFTKDSVTGICVKNVTAPAPLPNPKATESADKSFGFDWLKLLNSPLSGAVVASIIFAVYDKFFRTKN